MATPQIDLAEFCWVLFQRYMQQYNDVELSALGMGMYVLCFIFFCKFKL